MKLTEKNKEIIRSYFQNQPVLKAYLFGSFVRGEGQKDSDVDILVELDYSQKIGLQFVQMQMDLELLLDKKVDLVSEEGISKYIKPQVENEKELLYAR